MSDNTYIITTVISAVASIIAAVIGATVAINKKSRSDAIKEAEREARQSVRLESIERKLDIHNGYAEKITDMQRDMAVVKNDIDYIKRNRLND